MRTQASSRLASSTPGFSLVELIVVISILSVLTTIVIAGITNASRDARRVAVRAQQATLHEAVMAWVQSQTRDSSTGQLIGIASVQGAWNTYPSNFSRLQAVSRFLDPVTENDFVTGSTANGDKIQTSTMKEDGSWLTLPNWSTTSTGPEVTLNY